MSTTEAGRLTTSGKPDSKNRDGMSLQAVLESPRRLDELSGARIVANIAEAVHAAQRTGQPPAALTPPAILVSPDGGIAFAAAAVSPRYLAPEKLRGGSGDRRSDVFTLGVMLWEVLAHERLFAGDDDAAIRRAVLEAAVRPPSELNANVPAELDAICRRALARDPVERYQSAKGMAADIDAVLDDAGYPGSGEPIAAFVAAMAAPPPRPMAVVAPRADKPQVTMPLPAVQPPASLRPPTQPRAGTQPPTPRAGTQPPIVPPPATQPPVIQPPAEPPSASPPVATTRTAPLPSILPSPVKETLPPPFVPRQGASTTIFGSGSAAVPPRPAAPAAPLAPLASVGSAVRPARPAKTEILGSLSMATEAATEAATEKSPLARTAFLGSNALADEAPASTATPPGAAAEPLGPIDPTWEAPRNVASPIAAAVPAPMGSFASEMDRAPSFGPPAMPEPRSPAVAPPMAADGGAPAPAGSPRPSIADAETVETPQLDMPPGMTIAPASPPAPLRTADSSLDEDEDDEDGDFGQERHIDPAAVVALRNTGSRDVLAGWGWSNDSVQDLPDQDEFPDTTRASRKRLVIAIGGALGVVAVLAIAAFAFSGPPQPDPDSQVAARPAPAAPSTAPAADLPTAAPAAGEPATTEPPSPEPAPGAAPPPPATEPPTAAAPPPAPAAPAPEPPTAAAPPPAPAAPAPEPPAAAAPPPAPVAQPLETPRSAAPPPAAAAELPGPAAPAVEPPRPAAEPLPPPAKIAAEPARPPKVPEAKKPEAKKPAPRPPSDRALKRPAPPARIARATPRAQPIDPYGAVPDNPRTDPAAAYRTGLQQYARGDTSGALATFRTSLSTNPGFAPTWRGLGLVYEKLGNTAQARSSFQRYLKLAPDAPDADQVRDRLEHLGSGS